MRIAMSCQEYIRLLKAYSNKPLSLNRLTLPFGVISDGAESSSLLVGHVLDELASRQETLASIDCIDVLAAAYELGHDQAGEFLDQAPYILCRMAQELGLPTVH